MSIKVEFEFQTLDDAVSFFARISPLYSAPGAKEPATVTPVHIEIAPAQVEAVPAKPKKTKAEVAAPVPPTETAAVTQEQVRTALAALLAAKGVGACSALLKKYNVARVSELDPAVYAPFVEECAE